MQRRLVLAGALALVLVPADLSGQGSSVTTHSSCAVGMAAAGVASPCLDASGIFFNPSALAVQPSTIGIGVTGIQSSGEFTYDFTGETVERESKVSTVPFAFASYRVTDRLAVGIGGFAPYGLRLEWPVCPIEQPRNCGEANFEGRFASYDTELRNIYVQPTVAYQVAPGLSVGGGLDVVFSSIDLNQRVDLADQQAAPAVTFANLGIPRGTDFADANLSGDATSVTFNVGVLANPSEGFSFGIRYLNKVTVDFEGEADFTQVSTGLVLPPGNPLMAPAGTPVDALVAGQFASGGALADQRLATSLTLPYQLVVGVALRPVPNVKLLGDFQLTGWHDFDVAQIDFAENGPDQPLILDYQDAYTYRFGGEWMPGGGALALRGGFIYNTAAEQAASVSPLLPENERNYYTAGIGYRFGERLGIDLGYQLVDQADVRGRTRGRASFAQTAEQLNVGVYESTANVFNATLYYHFGGVRSTY
ncbi:outer membrane protein transport protein [soil metagenome]